MSYNTFPTFIGAGWDIKKRIITKTLIEESDAGSEFLLSKWSKPHFEFDLTWNYLSQVDRDALEDFIIGQLGPAIPFLLPVVNDSLKTGLACGTGNGVNKIFQIPLRPQAQVVTSTVKDNGAVAGANTVTADGLITFTTAPVNLHAITADITYAYLVRFKEDEQEINQMLSQMYEQQGITFRTRR